jgi:hypothetical protein
MTYNYSQYATYEEMFPLVKSALEKKENKTVTSIKAISAQNHEALIEVVTDGNTRMFALWVDGKKWKLYKR